MVLELSTLRANVLWELSLSDQKSHSTGRFYDFYAQFPLIFIYGCCVLFLLCLLGVDILQTVHGVVSCLFPLLFSLIASHLLRNVFLDRIPDTLRTLRPLFYLILITPFELGPHYLSFHFPRVGSHKAW